jgi:hypothetical protein
MTNYQPNKSLLLLGLLAFVFAGCVYYPETIPDKKAWLKQSADILRSAIDTNQIELACSKLTDQPETVLAIKNYSQQAIADLDKAAGLLLNQKLTSGGTTMGQLAEIIDPDNPKEIYYFDFSPYGRLCDFDKRTIAYTNGCQRTIMRMDFYNNGKLSMVAHSAGGQLCFGENGELENSIINGKYLIIK